MNVKGRKTLFYCDMCENLIGMDFGIVIRKVLNNYVVIINFVSMKIYAAGFYKNNKFKNICTSWCI